MQTPHGDTSCLAVTDAFVSLEETSLVVSPTRCCGCTMGSPFSSERVNFQLATGVRGAPSPRDLAGALGRGRGVLTSTPWTVTHLERQQILSCVTR